MFTLLHCLGIVVVSTRSACVICQNLLTYVSSVKKKSSFSFPDKFSVAFLNYTHTFFVVYSLSHMLSAAAVVVYVTFVCLLSFPMILISSSRRIVLFVVVSIIIIKKTTHILFRIFPKHNLFLTRLCSLSLSRDFIVK